MIFKQVFRVAFIALIWKQYKATIISTALLVVFLFVVGSVHDDYLAATPQEEVNRLTFVYKWLAYVIGVALYLVFHALRMRIKPSKETTQTKIEESKALNNTDEDPFAAIRERKKLRSRADFLIGDDEQE